MQSPWLPAVPALTLVPAEHLVQSSPVLPAPEATKVPAGQGTRSPNSKPSPTWCPCIASTHPLSFASYFPAGQFKQSFSRVPSPLATLLPSGQSMQETSPSVAYFPTAQGVHVPSLSADGTCPNGQNVHSADAICEIFPGTHATHSGASCTSVKVL